MLNTVSVITTPPINKATPMPITVTIGTPAFLKRVLQQHRTGRDALGLGGADVILGEHVEHGGARDARDERHIGEAERQGRQDEVARPIGRGFRRSAYSLAPEATSA